MNTREIASEYRLMQWSQALQERKARGETIGAFCESRGVSRNTYFYWQRRLREAAAKQLSQVRSEPSQALIPSGWAVCEEAKTEPEEKAVAIEIGKCRVMAESDVDPELLAKVCRVLMSLC